MLAQSHFFIHKYLKSALKQRGLSFMMSFLTAKPENSWQPAMTVDTTTTDYWTNWRVFLSGFSVLTSMVFSFIIICKLEGGQNSEDGNGEASSSSSEKRDPGILYEDEVWRPCLKFIHPAWLLAFRLFALFVLSCLLIVIVMLDGGSIFYFYTQWTFTLITFYFGLGSLLSMYGCSRYHEKGGGNQMDNEASGPSEEQGRHPSVSNPKYSSMSNAGKNMNVGEGNRRVRRIAGFWGYAFQIMFQMSAGAIVITDCVFWFIIVPFLTIKDHGLNFLAVNMHTVNAILLLGDTALNSLPFPCFRIAYFFLWTAFYVIFQWILHACVSLWWPYPFLDLSSSFAPLWYSVVALMHFPCYGAFVLVMKSKHALFSKRFPQSYIM